jgi:hypothetical protein
MLRDPYVAGVERFELPLWSNVAPADPAQYKEQAALFCVLLWEHFQTDVRSLRYHISFEQNDDATLEFEQRPYHEELLNFDSSSANQIDIEFISQQPARPRKHPRAHSTSEDEHFPAFLEVFIPLWPHPGNLSSFDTGLPKLVIWCQPSLLSQVTGLWEQSSALLLKQLSSHN